MNKLVLRDRLLDFFFPQVTCMLCGSAEQVQGGFCAECIGKMEPYRSRRIPKDAPYTGAISCFVYEDKVREALRMMKFRGQFDLPVRFFAGKMAEEVRKAHWKCDCVVPVPAEPRYERKRGYNQSEKLASRVAALLDLPMEKKALRKKRGTRSQVGLSMKQRMENMEGAILPGKSDVSGKTVLLVDDLMTTGATVHACAQALMKMGAKAVYVVTAAHAILEPDYKEKIKD